MFRLFLGLVIVINILCSNANGLCLDSEDVEAEFLYYDVVDNYASLNAGKYVLKEGVEQIIYDELKPKLADGWRIVKARFEQGGDRYKVDLYMILINTKCKRELTDTYNQG